MVVIAEQRLNQHICCPDDLKQLRRPFALRGRYEITFSFSVFSYVPYAGYDITVINNGLLFLTHADIFSNRKYWSFLVSPLPNTPFIFH
jgi:hypothetical protein